MAVPLQKAGPVAEMPDGDSLLLVVYGRVAEQGSPAELRERPEGEYRRMLELQRESGAWTL